MHSSIKKRHSPSKTRVKQVRSDPLKHDQKNNNYSTKSTTDDSSSISFRLQTETKATPMHMIRTHKTPRGDPDGSAMRSPWGIAGSSGRGGSAYTTRYSITRSSAIRSNDCSLAEMIPSLLPQLNNTLVTSRLNSLAWMCKACVQLKPQLKRRTFFIAASIMDRYLLLELDGGASALSLSHKIEVIGFSSLYLASKIEDAQSIDLDDILKLIFKKKYPIQKANIITEERRILNALKWQVSTSLLDEYDRQNLSPTKKKEEKLRNELIYMISETCLFNAVYLTIPILDLMLSIEHLVNTLFCPEDILLNFQGNKESLFFVVGIFSYIMYRYKRLKEVEVKNRPSTTGSCSSISTTRSVGRKKKVSYSYIGTTINKYVSNLEVIFKNEYRIWLESQRLINNYGGLSVIRDICREYGCLDVRRQ